MIKSLPWIILGGITLIAVVVVIEVAGAVIYLQSPDRVVRGAFVRLLNSKSFHVSFEASDNSPNGFMLKADGALDKQQLSKPVADFDFSFQTAGQGFYGKGEARAKGGEAYLRFDQITGIPGVLPGALQAIWADLNMDALLVVGHDRLFPQAVGNFTEADLQAIKAIALEHIPFKPAGKGDSGRIDLEPVMHYKIELDRVALIDLVAALRAAVKDSPLTSDENSEIRKMIAALPPVSGEVWIGRNDGALRAATVAAMGDGPLFRLNVRLSRYDRPVATNAPSGSKPLIELVRRLTGPTLGKAAIKLPFSIPVPIYDVGMKIPEISGSESSGSTRDLGGLPNLIRLFYGTDALFAPAQK